MMKHRRPTTWRAVRGAALRPGWQVRLGRVTLAINDDLTIGPDRLPVLGGHPYRVLYATETDRPVPAPPSADTPAYRLIGGDGEPFEILARSGTVVATYKAEWAARRRLAELREAS